MKAVRQSVTAPAIPPEIAQSCASLSSWSFKVSRIIGIMTKTPAMTPIEKMMSKAESPMVLNAPFLSRAFSSTGAPKRAGIYVVQSAGVSNPKIAIAKAVSGEGVCPL